MIIDYNKNGKMRMKKEKKLISKKTGCLFLISLSFVFVFLMLILFIGCFVDVNGVFRFG